MAGDWAGKSQRNLSAASRRLDLSCNEWKYGIWKDPDFVLELARRLKENEEIVVICGNNKKLEETLKRELRRDRRVRILGFTEQVAEYMEACDVILRNRGD